MLHGMAATWRPAGDVIALVLTGAAPGHGGCDSFKLSLATSNDLVSGQSWQASLTRLTDASRYWLIVKAMVDNMLAVGKAYVFILPLCFLLLGRSPHRPRAASNTCC